MIAAYFAERFRLIVFAPVALALAFAAGAGRSTPRALALDFGFALIALAHFRLWDDLADRKADALAHPDRVLVRARRTAPFVMVCLALGALALDLAYLRHPSGLLMLIGLQLGLGIWYTLRERRSPLGTGIVLSKYPLLLLILAGDRAALWPWPIAIAAIAAYASACAYEIWHDPAAFSLGGQS
jgi:hypothetical protein